MVTQLAKSSGTDSLFEYRVAIVQKWYPGFDLNTPCKESSSSAQLRLGSDYNTIPLKNSFCTEPDIDYIVNIMCGSVASVAVQWI